MHKSDVSPLVWVFALLPYEIGLLFVLFSDTTLWQAVLGGSLFYVLVAVIALPFRYPLVRTIAIVIGVLNAL
jgi:hypothetical protein